MLIVVFIFLGNFRATFIPMLAVPVSLVGTFAAFVALGFSINTLTMLAVVLAVGIVVDDAIVVVEAVEHHIGHGLSPLEATEKAMDEVSGPVVAIGLVLCAVFVPVSFMGGIVGQLYKQFAITISVSVILSVIVASDADAGALQHVAPARERRSAVRSARSCEASTRSSTRQPDGYLSGVSFFLRRMVIGLACLAGLWFGAGSLLMKVPTGFVPNEDQGYFFAVFNLPDGASMERTDALMRRAEADLKGVPGVQEVIVMGGLNLLTNAYISNNASIIVMLKPWEERKSEEEQLKAILMGMHQEVRRLSGSGHRSYSRRRRSTASATRADSSSNCRTGRAGRRQELDRDQGEDHAGHGAEAGDHGHLLRLQNHHSADQAGHRPRQGAHPEHSHQRTCFRDCRSISAACR